MFTFVGYQQKNIKFSSGPILVLVDVGNICFTRKLINTYFITSAKYIDCIVTVTKYINI